MIFPPETFITIPEQESENSGIDWGDLLGGIAETAITTILGGGEQSQPPPPAAKPNYTPPKDNTLTWVIAGGVVLLGLLVFLIVKNKK